ncbi:tetratricopeptide repeat protein [Acidicapsa acidisoli]|uniref:tetratricopeptide repeat protein n=1 Tax=Acidicapsa acidisoli TaxID=1615681 RepID=UPI0021DF5C0B|nr:tetratricopeptide repeat protein [Acidicapsa acidisoli]
MNSAMTLLLNRMRLTAYTGVLLLFACIALGSDSYAQEPSASLKQADADYRSGTAALARNDLKTALTNFQEVVRLAPSAEQGHSALGAVLVRLGRVGEGTRELEKALAMKPGDSSAQFNLALAYQQNGQPAKALPLFAKLESSARAEKRPLALSILIPYARALVAANQVQAAISKMKEAAALDPRSAELQDELGSLYAQREDWSDAEQAFSKALSANPDFAMAYMHRGLARKAEQQPGALDELAKAYQLAPENALVAVEYGQELANTGDDAQAIPVLEHAVKSDPHSTAAAYQLGLALQRVNRLDEAIALLQRASSSEPKNAEMLTNLGMALCQTQRAKDAVPILQRAVSLAPENPTAHQDLAAAFIQLNQFDDAVDQLRAALKISPNAAQLHYNLGLALKMEDDAAGAIPELEIAEKIDPSAPEPPYILGVLYMQVGRYAEAARELNVSLKLRPENGDGWATLGSVYSKLDQLSDAVTALREAIRQLPQQPDPHLTLAAVLARQNQPAEATEERRKAADLMRANMNRQRAEVATNSANSQLKSGNLEQAVAQFREALSFDADYTEAHAGLAKALEQEGKTAEATAERQKAEALAKDASIKR